MFTLPGQATVSTLLPLVQSVFPEDRHLFAYDGCISTVQRGLFVKRQFKKGQIQGRMKSIIHGMGQDPVRITTPLPSNSPLTKDISLKSLTDVFKDISGHKAQIVETWMSSVDAYFKLKQQENSNGYLPYCFKLTFLTKPVGNFEMKTDSYWSLNSLLQFITGCRSRALPEGVLDSAKEWLKDYNKAQSAQQEIIDKTVIVSEKERKVIESCCFQHKLILIENKTLQDTVLPKEHWTLKQASRAGCSCCGPDPYDQMEEEEEETEKINAGGIDMNAPGAFALGLNGSAGAKRSNETTKTPSSGNGYVDGKLGFAFDPTRF
jgi:hypothetical protein